MILTNEEAFDMVGVYFECMRNVTIAARVYAVQYPERRHPNRRVFLRLIHRLRTRGSVHLPVYRRHGRGRTEENTINVLAYVSFDPHLSTRAIARDLAISQTTVRNILREHRLHLYHIVPHQSLNARDFDSRLDFCNWLLNMIQDDPELLLRILWSDEATFRSDGTVNRHNMHYWSATNPHWMQEVQHQGRWSINVWCGILGGRIIGPFFLMQI
ncbi:hypothetical protein NQ315_014269 [Exocentrus adspersus]|uniref:DUF4817 domain-containing protein n=1 Tax=Exocentrus adspersus TaxID=1586481 RepID=A0AAV8VJ97_9CUCU|nr:hypothetical protein NQ315_014269 [Exocentrus adspersus]